jgi:SAM-dependent methyltransferase
MLAVAPKRAAASVIAILAALMTPVPLSFRKRVAVWCARLRMPGKQTFTLALLEDLATADPGAFHRFLWSNHLAYAITYEVPKRYGTCRIAEANQVLLSRISAILRLRGLDPDNTVEAVLDVGCSTGALLRYIETDVFRSASVLRGIDIDKHAVAAGTEYLSSAGSKVALVSADISEIDRAAGDRLYDVVLCCGVLSYLEESDAERSVARMLARTRHLLGIVCLAHPTIENSRLDHPASRPSDRSLIHNLDRLIEHTGGQVLWSHWEESRMGHPSPAYTVIAVPKS